MLHATPFRLDCSPIGTMETNLNAISNYNFMEFQYFSGLVMNNSTISGTTYRAMAPFFYCKSIKFPPHVKAVTNLQMVGNRTFTKKIVLNEGLICLNSACREYSNIVLDIPSTIQRLSPYIGFNATNMTVIIRAITPPVAIDSYKTQFKPTAIYVPDESVDVYKTHSYWSYYASKFKPLSEYTGS